MMNFDAGGVRLDGLFNPSTYLSVHCKPLIKNVTVGANAPTCAG